MIRRNVYGRNQRESGTRSEADGHAIAADSCSYRESTCHTLSRNARISGNRLRFWGNFTTSSNPCRAPGTTSKRWLDTGLVECLVQSERLFEGYPSIFRTVDQQRRRVISAHVVDGRNVERKCLRMFVIDAGEEQGRLVSELPAGHECDEVRRCIEADDRLHLAGNLARIGHGRESFPAARQGIRRPMSPGRRSCSGSTWNSSAWTRIHRTAARRSSSASGQLGAPGRASR